jgi:hypothetical protein
MLKTLKYWLFAVGLSACSTMPNGPSVLVLSGSGKDYARFHNDDMVCRNTAHAQVMAAPKAPDSKEEGQHRYDIDYIQCMYGQGHRVPVPQELLYQTHDQWHPPPPANLPPPQTTTP